MESISIFDIFKIGVGPSSSHTLGPWKAALDFRRQVDFERIDRIEIILYGSLSKTGKGHATNKAVQLGLLGYQPDTIDTASINKILADFNATPLIQKDYRVIHFNIVTDIIYSKLEKDDHPNTMDIIGYKDAHRVICKTYMSVGGGFIEEVGVPEQIEEYKSPYTINTARDIMEISNRYDIPISEIIMRNEIAIRSKEEVYEKLDRIYDVMKECVVKGCNSRGVLPGGLNVVRRAKNLAETLLEGQEFTDFTEFEMLLHQRPKDFNNINKWVSCFALAVNEENAAMGRVVTSPTNGAAGVIPAVLLYYHFFCDHSSPDDIYKFFCTSGAIGALFKKGATVSAAVGGCQAEIGVSAAMAAAGLTEVLGGTSSQAFMAAEIAMEHHLGMTCDPVGGLVQIPCIERNAMGAMKAITAANLALTGDPYHTKVDLDTVIKTMWDTAQGMNKQYKETSEGGLAFNIPVISPEC